MKLFFALCLIILISCPLHADPGYRIFLNDGYRMSLTELAQLCAEYDVIFFGEYHDNAKLHDLESRLLTLLYMKNRKLIVSFEMFERNTQFDLNRYLAGEINEEEFLKLSNPWPNYKTDYRPLLEFARERKLPVAAANIPRPIASHFAKTGTLATLDFPQRRYLPAKMTVLNDEYFKKFEETMKAMPMMKKGMNAPASMIQNLYGAQCLKDDTMAETIVDFLKEYPDRMVIHFNGDFHSRSHLGTAQKLHMMRPELKILVITPETTDDFWNIAFPAKPEGDVLIYVKER